MFLNANTGAKFAEDYARKQIILKARALAKANGGVVADADSSPKKPAKKSTLELSESSSTSTWLSDRNDKLRADAIANVQNAITKHAERKGLLSSTLDRLVEVAHARLQGSNERGMYRCTHVTAWKRRRRLYYAPKQTYIN
jgi:hypothetical protein